MKKKIKKDIPRDSKRQKIIISILLVLIMVFAFLVRRNTFWLPHWQGDQSHYLGLAMKLDKFGLDYYNLRGIKLKNLLNWNHLIVSALYMLVR